MKRKPNKEAWFSHSICPECSDELYGDEDWYKGLVQRNEKRAVGRLM